MRVPEIDYFTELRTRIIRVIVIISAIFLPLWFFSRQLYDLLALPLLKHLGISSLIAISITAPFFVLMKLAFVLAIFIALPYILYEFWSFVTPALYRHERKWIALLWAGTLLFYAGITFAYFLTIPWMLSLSAHLVPSSVELKPDMEVFFNFICTSFLIFGIAFEIPMILMGLIMLGIVTRAELRKKRRYVIVGAFILGMLLTPPDVMSQIMVAIPLWLLFEVGLLLGYFLEKRQWAKHGTHATSAQQIGKAK